MDYVGLNLITLLTVRIIMSKMAKKHFWGWGGNIRKPYMINKLKRKALDTCAHTCIYIIIYH